MVAGAGNLPGKGLRRKRPLVITQLVLLDPVSGRVRSEYWHPGYLSGLSFLLEDLDGDGSKEVMAGGFNNPEQGPGHAALLVLGIPFKDPQAGIRNIFGDPAGQEETYLLSSRPDVWTLQEETCASDQLPTATAGTFGKCGSARSGPPNRLTEGIPCLYIGGN